MKYYKIKMKTLAPIYIGSGEQINKLNYCYSNRRAKIIDENKLLNVLTDIQIKKFADFVLSSGSKGTIEHWSEFNILKEKDIYKYEVEVEKPKYEVEVEEPKIKTEENNSLNEINTFIKTMGKPYIPGSSLKGALRTAILSYDISRGVENKDTNKFNNFWNALQISDSKPIDFDKLYITKRIDLPIHREEDNLLPAYSEFIKPNTEIEIEMSINENVFYELDYIKNALSYFIESRINLTNIIVNKRQDNYNSDYNQHANLFFGGYSGAFNKTTLYDERDGLDKVINVLSYNFDKPLFLDGKRLKLKDYDYRYIDKWKDKSHNHHIIDVNYEVSPHTVKVAQYKNVRYLIGFAKLEFEEME